MVRKRQAPQFLELASREAAQEAHQAEIDADAYGEDDAPPQTRTRLPEQSRVTTADGGQAVYGLYESDGLRRSLDSDAGLRSYKDSKTHVFGYYGLGGVSQFVSQPIEIETFPADVNEYDGVPALDEALEAALGRRAPIVVGDRGFFLRPFHAFQLNRQTAVVASPKDKIGPKPLIGFRNVLFDEFGVPRCPACDGPGNTSYPGLGFGLRGRNPVERFRCLLCGRVGSIACREDPLFLNGLSRLRETYHAVAARHQVNEGQHRHNKQRFNIGGRELADCLPHFGIRAHQLRTAAALLLLWQRLSLRNGWIASGTPGIIINEASPVRLSAVQDRRSLVVREAGIGSTRLERLMDTWEARGLHVPYSTGADR